MNEGELYQLDSAIFMIRYDTSVDAGDDRPIMQAAAANLRNGIRNQATRDGLVLARKWLARAALR